MIKAHEGKDLQEKPTLYLAGDSTMQSYSLDKRPQYGWGEFLLEGLMPGQSIRGERRTDCLCQKMKYVSPLLDVDNYAMAGISSRSFREQGRFADIAAHLTGKDALLVQFGHNDAARGKSERYVPVGDFASSLKYYLDAARKVGALFILVSPISMRLQDISYADDIEELREALPRYTEVMRMLAKKEQVALIDMLAMTEEYQLPRTQAERDALYREDGVHLTRTGARAYALLCAASIRRLWNLFWIK